MNGIRIRYWSLILPFPEAVPVTADPMMPLPGLSPVSGKTVVARFDGGELSSDAGVLALREIEACLGVAARLAACLGDPRAPGQTIHGLAEIIRFRLLIIGKRPSRGWKTCRASGR